MGELLREAFGEVMEPVHEEAPYEANLPEKEPARVPNLTTQIKPPLAIHAKRQQQKRPPRSNKRFLPAIGYGPKPLGSPRSLHGLVFSGQGGLRSASWFAGTFF